MGMINFAFGRLGRQWGLLVVLAVGFPGLAAGSEGPPAWAASWATASKVQSLFDAPTPMFNDVTLRQVVRLSAGGRSVRVWFTNEFGTEALTLGAATVALRDVDSAVTADSLASLTFGGESQIVIPPGGRAVSDPVAMVVPHLADLVISAYLPQDLSAQTSPASYHVRALQTSYIAPGDQTASVDLVGASLTTAWFYLSAVDVRAPGRSQVIAAFGDSITDGDQLSSMEPVDENARYSNLLARKLLRNSDASVVNLGISGNQLSADFIGENMLARLNRDVLAQTGLTHVIVLGGINDMGLPVLLGAPAGASADTLIATHQQIAASIKAQGVTAIGGTITPSGSVALPGYNSAETQATRAAVNEWIRNSGAYDLVVDFDRVLRDPENPGVMRADLTADGLHPNSAGYEQMARAVFRALGGLEE